MKLSPLRRYFLLRFLGFGELDFWWGESERGLFLFPFWGEGGGWGGWGGLALRLKGRGVWVVGLFFLGFCLLFLSLGGWSR